MRQYARHAIATSPNGLRLRRRADYRVDGENVLTFPSSIESRVARKQCGACADFSGEENWRGGVGAAELECQVARATGTVRVDSAAGDYGGEDEHAVSRPADGQGARTRGPDLRTEYWADATSESASGSGYAAMFAVAGAARL